MSAQVKQVVFGSGGFRHHAYAGALLALQEQGLFEHVTGFGGTSTGAIVAALAGVGYSPEEIVTRVAGMDFGKVRGKTSMLGPLRVLAKHGFFDTEYITEQLSAWIGERIGDPLADIETCERNTGHRIRIVATNLSKRTATIFPSLVASRVSLVEAVRFALTVPLLFEPKRWQGDVYVDGAMVWNLPIEVFDANGEPDIATLGFVIREADNAPSQEIDNLHEYVVALMRTWVRAQETSFTFEDEAPGRVVAIDGLEIPPLELDLSHAQKWALVESGRMATHALLERRVGRARERQVTPKEVSP